MGMKCANCNKGIMYGHNVSHSKRRTKRIFKPNLHVSRIMVDGRAMRVKLCTKCLRMFKNAMKVEKVSSASSPQVTKAEEVAPQVATV